MPVETTSHPPEAAPPSGPARRGLTDGGRRAALVTLAAAVVVLGLGAWAVGDGQPLPGEVGTVEAWNRLPAAVGWPLRAIMQLGTLWAGLAAVAAAAWWCRRVGMLAPAALLLSVAVAYRLDNVLKDLIERPRPYDVLPDLVARDHVGGFAYPSGHTTMAVAIVAGLHPVLPGEADRPFRDHREALQELRRDPGACRPSDPCREASGRPPHRTHPGDGPARCRGPRAGPASCPHGSGRSRRPRA